MAFLAPLLLEALPEIGSVAAEAGEAGAAAGEAGEAGGALGGASEFADAAAGEAESAEFAEEAGDEGGEEAAEAAEEAEEPEEEGEGKEEAKGEEGKDGKEGKEKKTKEEKKKEAEDKKKEAEDKKKEDMQKQMKEESQERQKEMKEARKEAVEGAKAAKAAATQSMQEALADERNTQNEIQGDLKEVQGQLESKQEHILEDLKSHKLKKLEMADAFGTQAKMADIEGKELSNGELLETVSGGKALRGFIPTRAEWRVHRQFTAIRGPEGAIRSVEPHCVEHEVSSESMASATTMVSYVETFGFSAALASTFASSSSTAAEFHCMFGGGGFNSSEGSAGSSTAGEGSELQESAGVRATVKFQSRTHTLFKALSRYRITLPEAPRIRLTPDAAQHLNLIWACKQRLGQAAVQREDLAPIRAELSGLTKNFFRLYGSHIMRGPVHLGGMLAIRGEACALEEMTALELDNSASTACRSELGSGQSSSVTVQGSVGFLGVGGSFSHAESEQSGQASGLSVHSGQAAALQASQKAGRTCTRTQKTWVGGQPTDDVGQWTASLLQGDEYLEVFDRGTELMALWEVVRYAFDDVGEFKDVLLTDDEYNRLISHSTKSPIHGHRIVGAGANKELFEGWVLCSDLTQSRVRANATPDVPGKLADFLETEFYSIFGEDCYCNLCRGQFLPTELAAHKKQCWASRKYETDVEARLEGGNYELRQDDPLDDRTLGFYLVQNVECPLCRETVPATLLDEHLQTGECTFDMRISSLDGLPQGQQQQYTDFKMHDIANAGFKSGFYRLSCDCNMTYASPPEGFALVPNGTQLDLKPLFVMFEQKIDDPIRNLFRRGYRRTAESSELTLRYETLDRLFDYVQTHRVDRLLLTLFDQEQRALVRGCINNLREGETLLSIACGSGEVDAAQLLLEQRASPNLTAGATSAVGVHVETQPLVAAIAHCHLDTVRLLLNHKASVNARLDGADLLRWADWLQEGFEHSERASAPLQMAIRKYGLYTSPELYDEFAALHFEGVIQLLVDEGAVALPLQWGLTKKLLLKFNPDVQRLIEQAVMYRLAGFPTFLKRLIQRVDFQGQAQCSPRILRKVCCELQELISMTEGFAKIEQRRLLRLHIVTKSLERVDALFRRMDRRSRDGEVCCDHLRRAARILMKAEAGVRAGGKVLINWESRPELHSRRGVCVQRHTANAKWSVQVRFGPARRQCSLAEDQLVPLRAEWEDLARRLLPEPAAEASGLGKGKAPGLALPKLSIWRSAPRDATSGCVAGALDGCFGALRRCLLTLEQNHPQLFEAGGDAAASAVAGLDELLTGSRAEVALLRHTSSVGAVLQRLEDKPCNTTWVRLHACRALTRLLSSGEAAADEASSNNAVETLLQLLRTHSDSALVQAYGCDALSRVLDGSSSEASEDAAKEGLEILVEAIHKHSEHKVTQAYASMALKVLLGRNAAIARACTDLGGVGVLGEALEKGLSYHPLAQMVPEALQAMLRQCQEDDSALGGLLDGSGLKALKALQRSLADYPGYPIRSKATSFAMVRLCTGLLRAQRVLQEPSAEIAQEACGAAASLLRDHPATAAMVMGGGNADLVLEIICVLDNDQDNCAATSTACRALRWILVRCASKLCDRSPRIMMALKSVVSRADADVLKEVSGTLAELWRLFPQRAQEALEDGDMALQLTDRLCSQRASGIRAEICRALAWIPLVKHHLALGKESRLRPAVLAQTLMEFLKSETDAGEQERCVRLQQQAVVCLLHLVAPEDVDMTSAAVSVLAEIREAVVGFQDGQGEAILAKAVSQNPANCAIEVHGKAMLQRLRFGKSIDAVLERMDAKRDDVDLQGISCFQLYQAVANDPLTRVSRKEDIAKRLRQAKDQAGSSSIVSTYAKQALLKLGCYDAGEDTSLLQAGEAVVTSTGGTIEKDVADWIDDIRGLCGAARRTFVTPVTDALLREAEILQEK